MLADFDHLDKFGRIAVEIDHVARFLGRLGSGIHGDTDIGLRQRRSVVGAVAHHGHQTAQRLFAADVSEFVLGSGFGDKIIHPGFPGDGFGGQRVVAGDHHHPQSHGAQPGKAVLNAGFQNIGKSYNA
ncbi:hypothetical protein SDC9_185079 [bioreactor metagenome]|uniref:Uncharacterized protein n=1 Tax=bioreactor metagenome TaxID=1076179 RepID=A0A645HH89_9ZZZZ